MKEGKKKKQLNNYARYSGLGFQMLAIILAGVFGGIKLDEFLAWGFPVFTIVFSLLAVFLSIYYAVKDFLKMSNRSKNADDESKGI
ncbi:MAG: AtpZ/AtpI family protein [Bacteroidota bacterium]|nr:AtpZ/AtpI family protein [Bacteroidota bacterium]